MSSEIPRLNLLSSPLSGKYKNLIFILTIIALIGLGAAGYSFFQYQSTQKELKAIKQAAGASQSASGDQLSKILVEIGKIMKLPEGEIPTMATISDIAKLKDQPFFQNAKNGDVLLVFNKAGKAILYNPTDKKIVEVAPVNNASTAGSPRPSGSSSPSPSPTPSPFQPKLVLRNGTSLPSLTSKIETQIKKSFPSATIVAKENAARDTYDKTIAVIINQAAKDSAEQIAKNLGISIAGLPSAEKKPAGVDIVIILGKDKI